MPNFAALQGRKENLIRKALGGSLFVAPITADAITTLTTSDGSLTALPAGYTDGGCLTEDGMRFARSVDVSEVTSFGSYTPTRSDITSDSETLEVDFQETNRQTISLFTGASLASLVPNASSGELKITKPDRPSARYYRMLGLAVDGPEEAEIYIARFLPRAKVTDYADQAFGAGDDPIQWGVTVTAEKDPTLGSSVIYYFGGPGWKALLTQMGFSAS